MVHVWMASEIGTRAFQTLPNLVNMNKEAEMHVKIKGDTYWSLRVFHHVTCQISLGTEQQSAVAAVAESFWSPLSFSFVSPNGWKLRS